MMKHTFHICILLLLCLYLQAQPQRVRATPHPICVAQPNGDSLTIRLHGDEHGHFHTTADGYKIKKNDKDFFCYVKTDKRGKEKISWFKAHNPNERKWCEKRFLRKQKQLEL